MSAWLPCHVARRKRDLADSHIPKKGHLLQDIAVLWRERKVSDTSGGVRHLLH